MADDSKDKKKTPAKHYSTNTETTKKSVTGKSVGEIVNKLPPAVQRSIESTGVQVKQGAPEQGYSQPAIASVDTNSPNTIVVHDPQRFAQGAGQVLAHEATHIWQNNLPPSVQKNIPPDNPSNPYDFGGTAGLQAMRAQGLTLEDLPREQAARIIQTATVAQNDPSLSPAEKAAYQPWLNDMATTPLSTVMPTEPSQQGINTTVRPPQLPVTMYDDQLIPSSGQGNQGNPPNPPNSSSGMAAVSFDAPLQQATTISVPAINVPNVPPAGVVFDAPTATATTVSLSLQTPQSVSNTPTAAPTAAIGPLAQPNSVSGKLERWAGNVAHDLEYGTDLTGVGSVLKGMGAHGVYNGNSQAVGDFMASLPLGLLKATKGAAELPQSGKRVQGAKDIASGVLQSATIPSAFAAPEGAEAVSAGLDRAGEAAASGVGKAVNLARKPFSLKAVQEALQNSKDSIQQALQSDLQGIQDNWHGSVRDLFDQVAQDAGVQPKPAESLRDVAANTAQAVKAKASQMYQQLDKAVGGTRFQTFDEQISNVKRALRNSAGIDPDADGRLVERVNNLEDAKAKALDQAKAAGVDPDLIDQANSAWRQASALEDLSKHVQASTSGLRGDIAQGVNAAKESVSPSKLATRANRMYSSGRLQQALGDDNADDLLKTIESTKQEAKDAAENAVKQTEAAISNAAQKYDAVKLRRYMAVGSGIASVPGFELLKHLVGE